MKKISKGLTILLSAAMTACIMSDLSASALWQTVDMYELMVNPNADTYEEYEVNNQGITYRNTNDLYNFYTYGDLKYNLLTLDVAIGSDWKSVYEEHSKVLDFDNINQFELYDAKLGKNIIRISMYDVLDEGDDPRNAISVYDKQKDIEQFCKALNERGILLNASYKAFQSEVKDWRVEKCIEVDGFSLTDDDIKAVTDKYVESVKINLQDGRGSIVIDDDLLSYDDFISMYDELDALDENDKLSKIFSQLASVKSTDSIDILAEIRDKAENSVPSISASADYRYYSIAEDVDITKPPADYEYCQETDLYKNHKECLFGPIVYRSILDKNLFVSYLDFSINCLELKVTDDKWEEIYNKYKDELGLSSTGRLPDDTVRMVNKIKLLDCNSYEECVALIEEQNESINEKYEIIMNMCSEMYKAGCIAEATYTPFRAGEGNYYVTSDIEIEDFGDITIEEIKDVVNSVTDKMSFYASNDEFYRLCNGEGTAEDYFAALDVLKEAFGDRCKITAHTAYTAQLLPQYSAEYGYTTIDLIAELEKNAGIAYGDANIDDHIGIQDAIVMNKSIIGAVELNEDQNKVVDLNKDGNVNSEDLNLLLRYLVDDVDTLPIKK